VNPEAPPEPPAGTARRTQTGNRRSVSAILAFRLPSGNSVAVVDATCGYVAILFSYWRQAVRPNRTVNHKKAPGKLANVVNNTPRSARGVGGPSDCNALGSSGSRDAQHGGGTDRRNLGLTEMRRWPHRLRLRPMPPLRLRDRRRQSHRSPRLPRRPRARCRYRSVHRMVPPKAARRRRIRTQAMTSCLIRKLKTGCRENT
jgi:hypothetical protein